MRFVLALLVFTALVAAVHAYLWLRLVRDVTERPRLRRLGKFGFAAVGVFLVAAAPLGFVLPDWADPLVAWPAFLWIGALGPLLSALVLAEPLRFVLTRRARASARKDGEETPVDASRRLLLGRALSGVAVGSAASFASYGVFRAYAEPEVSELSLKLPGFPSALSGLRVVQLTDIHVGDLIETRFMDELVRRTMALRPDLVAITGDLMDGDVPALGAAVGRLQRLSSRFGTFFCTGNHEYYSGVTEWSDALTQMGIGVLRNRHVRVGDAGGAFTLAGVDDWKEDYDLDRALAGRDPSLSTVLLAHRPNGFESAAKKGVHLQLSGHTHAGQVFPATLVTPFLYAPDRGLRREGGAALYVSRGTGFWGPPMRLGSPPEIVVVNLTA